MNGETWIDDVLEHLKGESLERRIRVFDNARGLSVLNFSSNDYLGLSHHPVVIQTAEEYLCKYGSGGTASRLMAGTMSCHVDLEERLASIKGYPEALLFGSGYLANLGMIQATVGRGDNVFADRLVHASIIDAVILSGAKIHRFSHNDSQNLADMMARHTGSGRTLIVTESVFSMDGDLAPLKDICDVSSKHGAMVMVDEAHATGVFGEKGEGLVSALGLTECVNLSMGTMGKALAGYGGFVACSAVMKQLLVNKARSFIYTTSLPPSVIGAVIGALTVMRENPDMGSALLENSVFLRSELNAAGFDTGASESQIVPVIIGDSAKALALSLRLEKEGVMAIAVRPPTVPVGTARLRLSVNASHSREDLVNTVSLIADCARKEGIL